MNTPGSSSASFTMVPEPGNIAYSRYASSIRMPVSGDRCLIVPHGLLEVGRRLHGRCRVVRITEEHQTGADRRANHPFEIEGQGLPVDAR